MEQKTIEHPDRYKFYDMVAKAILEINHDDKCIVQVSTFFDELAETNIAIINYRQ